MDRKTIWTFWISLVGILCCFTLGLVEVIVLHKDEMILTSVTNVISIIVGMWLGARKSVSEGKES